MKTIQWTQHSLVSSFIFNQHSLFWNRRTACYPVINSNLQLQTPVNPVRTGILQGVTPLKVVPAAHIGKRFNSAVNRELLIKHPVLAPDLGRFLGYNRHALYLSDSICHYTLDNSKLYFLSYFLLAAKFHSHLFFLLLKWHNLNRSSYLPKGRMKRLHALHK